MGMNWHELRDTGHDRLHDAIAEAQLPVVSRILRAPAFVLDDASGGIGFDEVAGHHALTAACA